MANSLNTPIDELKFDHTADLMFEYGLGLVPSLSSITLFKLDNSIKFSDNLFQLHSQICNFCSDNSAALKEYQRMTKVFQKGMMKAIEKSKKVQNQHDDYKDYFSF
jgi:hypothetical protein